MVPSLNQRKAAVAAMARWFLSLLTLSSLHQCMMPIGNNHRSVGAYVDEYFCFTSGGIYVYVSNSRGSDGSGNGTQISPFQSIRRALESNNDSTVPLHVLLDPDIYSGIGNANLSYTGSVSFTVVPNSPSPASISLDGNFEHFLTSYGSSNPSATQPSCFAMRQILIQYSLSTSLVLAQYSEVYIVSSMFDQTRGEINNQKGGALYSSSTVSGANFTIVDTLCNQNAAGWGGCLYLDYPPSGNVNITNTSISYNRATRSGGGVYILGASSLIAMSSFYANTGGEGGAVYYEGKPISPLDMTELTLRGDIFLFNSATMHGGAVATSRAIVLIEGFDESSVEFRSNEAGKSGGAIYIIGGLQCRGSDSLRFFNNTASAGAAIFLNSTVPSQLDFLQTSDESLVAGESDICLQGGQAAFSSAKFLFDFYDLEIYHILLGNGAALNLSLATPEEENPSVFAEVESMLDIKSSFAPTLLYQKSETYLEFDSILTPLNWTWYGGVIKNSGAGVGHVYSIKVAEFRFPTVDRTYLSHHLIACDLQIAVSLALFSGVHLELPNYDMYTEIYSDLIVMENVKVSCEMLTIYGSLKTSGSATILATGIRFTPEGSLQITVSDTFSPLVSDAIICHNGTIIVYLTTLKVEMGKEIVLATFASLDLNCKPTSKTVFGSKGQLVEAAEFYFTETELVVVPYPEPEEGRHLWMVVIAVVVVVVVVVVGAAGTGLCLHMRRRGEGYEEKYLIDPVERVRVTCAILSNIYNHSQ